MELLESVGPRPRQAVTLELAGPFRKDDEKAHRGHCAQANPSPFMQSVHHETVLLRRVARMP
jgi:hypothetical protein